MNLSLKPGRYVVAVSGGVDSMALLHLLKDLPDIHLTVAHFDHGIREDSEQDRLLVQRIAKDYGLPFAKPYPAQSTGPIFRQGQAETS
jgi:tRNA(Ile)-lysidine synthase TilS/MesJ